VMTSYGEEDEIEGFKHIIELFPTGIVSLVSDQFDLWQVVTKFLPKLKDKILLRDGKIVIRPDSGNPVDVLCGTYVWENKEEWEKYNGRNSKILEEGVLGIDYEETTPEESGLIELLWDIFGGTYNKQGYKVLNKHIGAIYGDAITLERAEEILKRLELKGFASTNVVLGVGSYSLGFATRDNQGGAIKATYIELETICNEDLTAQGGPGIGDKVIIGRDIYKDPKTDSGLKKSARGLLQVYNENGIFKLKDRCTKEEEELGELKEIYINSNFTTTVHINDIRTRILNHLNKSL